ncbi:MAG TPA: M42 family metallopeptidase [Clostridiaceae bacterium]|nr:M42 family metallopeptidase [Clostridiaceae bacterium]
MIKKSDKSIFENLLKPLSDARGASGFEHEISALVAKQAASYGLVERDQMQNVYISRADNGTGPRLLLDAHLDEVGFIVQAVLENGTLAILPLGGWVASNVPGHRFQVRTKDGSWIIGITASKPPHFMSEAERAQGVKLEQIVLDVGAMSREEAIKEFGIGIGLPVVPAVECEYDEKNDLLIGKAFDCRLGCAAILATLESLRGEVLPAEIIAAFSTQEELGLRGAEVVSKKVEPDLAIVFEGAPADDTFMPNDRVQTAIGKGPMLRHFDRKMVTNPAFQQWVLDLAAELDIPVQPGVRSGGATNGGVFHLSATATPTIVLAVPVRYIHSFYGIAKLADFKALVRLAVAVIRRIDGDFLDNLSSYFS